MSTSWIVPFVTSLLVFAIIELLRYRARRRASAHLDRLVLQAGFTRRATETDEELRARCRRTLAVVSPLSRAGIVERIEGAIWRHGFHRVRVTVDSDQRGGVVHARVDVHVPVAILRIVEDEVRDFMPMFAHLVLTAPTAEGT